MAASMGNQSQETIQQGEIPVLVLQIRGFYNLSDLASGFFLNTVGTESMKGQKDLSHLKRV